MDVLFIRLALSFLIGGSWVTVITLATVKYGAKVGGLLAGFPSTVAFSLAFIAWTQSVQSAVDATTALPFALGSTASFSLVYARLVKRFRFSVSLFAALGYWVVCSTILTGLVLTFKLSFALSVVGFYAIALVAYLALADKREGTASSHGVRPTAFQWVWRFVLSGGVIVSAVFVSQEVGPSIGGVVSSFPAIIISTTYILSRVEGIGPSRSVAVPVLAAAVFSVVPYVALVRYTYPVFGIAEGTLIAYSVAIPLAFLAFYAVSARK